MKTVGIIGGLGPETTAEFYLSVVFACQEKDRNHRPAVLISSVPIPYALEKDAIQEGKGIERFIPFLQEEAKRLEKSGSDFIVMPCNSLHIFIEEIRSAVKVPVLSIIEETTKFIKENGFKKVGIVSTSLTIQNRLYQNAFEKEGIAFLEPDPFQQAKLGKIIHNLVTGMQKNQDREEIIKTIEGFVGKADCVILACTDLQLLIPQHPTLRIFDSMQIFSDATVEKMLE